MPQFSVVPLSGEEALAGCCLQALRASWASGWAGSAEGVPERWSDLRVRQQGNGRGWAGTGLLSTLHPTVLQVVEKMDPKGSLVGMICLQGIGLFAVLIRCGDGLYQF